MKVRKKFVAALITLMTCLDIGHAGQTHSTHPTQPKECNAVKRLLSRWGLASCPELNKPPKEKPSHALTASGEPDGNPHTPRLEQGPTHEGKNPKKGRKGPFRARITQVWPDSGNSDVPTVPAVPAVPVEVLYPPVCKNSQQERLYFPTTNAPELQCSAKKCPSTCIYNGQIWTPDNDNPPPDYEFDLRFGKLLKKRKGFESSLVIPFELMDTCPEGRDCIKHYNLYIVEPTTHEGIISGSCHNPPRHLFIASTYESSSASQTVCHGLWYQEFVPQIQHSIESGNTGTGTDTIGNI